MRQLVVIVFFLLISGVFAQIPATDWKTELDQANKALVARDYQGAAAHFQSALEAGGTPPVNDQAMFDALRGSATVARYQGHLEAAEQSLVKAIEICARTHGQSSPELAPVLSELATVQRARGERAEAIASLKSAIGIREANPTFKSEDLARDLTSQALLESDRNAARGILIRALAAWETVVPPDSPQLLPVIDALAALARDAYEYAEAEPLLLLALIIRQAALGPDSSELLATLDSLAYVYFGEKKYAEAEPVYKRLLELWQLNAGPEHPMVALTLDKMSEFYAAQERYPEAEQAAFSALELRTRMHMASLNQAGRMLVIQAKLDEAGEWYRTAVQIGDLSKATSQVLDPLLRIYARILDEQKKPEEASAIRKRVIDAVMKQERQTPPVPAAPSTPKT